MTAGFAGRRLQTAATLELFFLPELVDEFRFLVLERAEKFSAQLQFPLRGAQRSQ